MYGNDWQYARTRLIETVVRVKKDNTPVMIHDVTRTKVVCSALSDGDTLINLKLDDLDVKPVNLGYLNYNGVASYIVRVPKRRDWRQGMRYGNIKSLSGISAQHIPLKYYDHVIRGEYPSLDKVIKSSKTVKDSIAWHKHWALDRSGQVLYKGTNIVGKLIEGQILLNEHRQYLREYLDECSR